MYMYVGFTDKKKTPRGEDKDSVKKVLGIKYCFNVALCYISDCEVKTKVLQENII